MARRYRMRTIGPEGAMGDHEPIHQDDLAEPRFSPGVVEIVAVLSDLAATRFTPYPLAHLPRALPRLAQPGVRRGWS